MMKNSSRQDNFEPWNRLMSAEDLVEDQVPIVYVAAISEVDKHRPFRFHCYLS